MPNNPKIPALIKPDVRLTTQLGRHVITTTNKNGPVLSDGTTLAFPAGGVEMPAAAMITLDRPATEVHRSILTGLRPGVSVLGQELPKVAVMAELGALKAKRLTTGTMPKVSTAQATGLATDGDEAVHMKLPDGIKRGDDTLVAGAGYVRILASVVGGEVVIRDLAHVPGDLAEPAPLFGGVGYEVVLDGKHIHAGEVPDPGVRRGFAPPDDPSRGHSFVAVEDFDFVVRVPMSTVPAARIPELSLSVFQVHGEAVLAPVGDVPLAKQYSAQLRTVASVPALSHAMLEHKGVTSRIAEVTGKRFAGAFTRIQG